MSVRYGLDINNYFCEICNTDKYNSLSNNTKKCKSCNTETNNNKGILCIKNGNIYVSLHYWVGFENNNIISSICPSGYCCSNNDKCNYIDNKNELCALNGNYKSILCGKCIDGYSESMNISSNSFKILFYPLLSIFNLSRIANTEINNNYNLLCVLLMDYMLNKKY